MTEIVILPIPLIINIFTALNLSFYYIFLFSALSVCLPESVPSVTFGTFNWPQTRAGIVSLINCPNQQPGGKVITASRSWFVHFAF